MTVKIAALTRAHGIVAGYDVLFGLTAWVLRPSRMDLFNDIGVENDLDHSQASKAPRAGEHNLKKEKSWAPFY